MAAACESAFCTALPCKLNTSGSVSWFRNGTSGRKKSIRFE
jgi:hypothetical protein